MSRKKNRKKNFIKQIAVVDKTPVKQEEQIVQMDLGEVLRSSVRNAIHLLRLADWEMLCLRFQRLWRS